MLTKSRGICIALSPPLDLHRFPTEKGIETNSLPKLKMLLIEKRREKWSLYIHTLPISQATWHLNTLITSSGLTLLPFMYTAPTLQSQALLTWIPPSTPALESPLPFCSEAMLPLLLTIFQLTLCFKPAIDLLRSGVEDDGVRVVGVEEFER
jgi:hypothetical protein